MDLRLPIGSLFSFIGAVLAIYGALSDPAIYARSLGYNVNLWWGLTLLAFGLTFVYFARRTSMAKAPGPPAVPELPTRAD
jgi:hypothetical protein